MSVVPFPGLGGGRDPSDETVPTLLITVSAAICELGEPVLPEEIALFLVQTGLPELADLTPDGVETLLVKFGPDGDGRLIGAAVFRPVKLGERRAWSFMPWFRPVLSQAGITMTLRGD